ncbi:hypothetical protein PgNI_05547 [Pyricularia grisea]|uniref:Uncharacterized protein n=1 Tax=Pyricularia grisea TaxID=148305 RepID=A0A6P8B6P6_PYRGI|nr:hypothetical protein PgNI_05547 [Pyricularia grisea]TLD10940.1 hypothetical protein PgNI_05547 [Pyricularia grisea]
MSEFLGSRISLISKSDIRYVGVLHEINSEESTVSLENVKSFGTEGRKRDAGKPAEEIAPSDQVYEYIVFRGSDVKDLRIEQAPVVKEQAPPAVPDDPAIVGARPRPGAAPAGPPAGPPGGPHGHHPPPFPGAPYYGNWNGQGGPAGPGGPGGPAGPGGPGFNGFPYPPPPNWFPPPGQAFPPGPGPWNNYGMPPPGAHHPPGPGGPGPRQPQQGPQQPQQQQEQKPAPIGARGDKARTESPAAQQPQAKPPGGASAANQSAPTPPVDSKPSVEEVKATAASLNQSGFNAGASSANKQIPTGPKGTRITPAVPLPAALTQKSAQQTVGVAGVVSNNKPTNAANTAAAIRDATQAAKAAVAVAMANMERGDNAVPQATAQPSNGNTMDNLTNKVNEMRVNATRGGGRGGRGRGGPRQAKVEVPDSDFDFASANAKFNKDDLVKEAIAGDEAPTAPAATNEDPAAPPAYNKASSFFDNISSEAKDRAENGGQKPGGREWRGEEQRRNMETFGQGSVDGGNRYGGYRGRGRGRGGMRGRGGNGGRGRGFRRGDGQATAQ